jgi:hypothetical protein
VEPEILSFIFAARAQVKGYAGGEVVYKGKFKTNILHILLGALNSSRCMRPQEL